MLLQIMEFPANYEGQAFQLELQMFPMEIISQKVTSKKYGMFNGESLVHHQDNMDGRRSIIGNHVFVNHETLGFLGFCHQLLVKV